jgi:hypothetical protein
LQTPCTIHAKELEVNTVSERSIDFVEALKRPFSDIRKFLIGAILGIIPFVNFTVIGYTLTSTGFTKEGVKKDSLPEWENYGDLFKKGLVAAIIGIILFLPAVLVLLGTVGGVAVSPAMSLIFGGIPMETWDKLAAGQITDMQIQDWFAQNWTQFIPLFTNAVPFLILGALLAAVAYYVMPAALLGWLKEDRFGAAFSWKALRITTTLDYLVNWLIVGFLGGIVSSLLGWVPFIGMGITMYARGVFSYTVYSEIYDRAVSGD